MKIRHQIFLLFIFLLLQGCGSSVQNLSISKFEVRRYYESGEHQKEVEKIMIEAAEEIRRIQLSSKAAVVFDVDETSLNNYEGIEEVDFGYVPHLWNEWVLQAEAPALNPVKEFYDFLIQKNVKIIFLTGRPEEHYEATYKNLLKAGYEKFDTLIVKSSGYDNVTSAVFKAEVRDALKKKGYTITASVGDQLSDFEGGSTGIRIKLPNYLYIVD